MYPVSFEDLSDDVVEKILCDMLSTESVPAVGELVLGPSAVFFGRAAPVARLMYSASGVCARWRRLVPAVRAMGLHALRLSAKAHSLAMHASNRGQVAQLLAGRVE